MNIFQKITFFLLLTASLLMACTSREPRSEPEEQVVVEEDTLPDAERIKEYDAVRRDVTRTEAPISPVDSLE